MALNFREMPTGGKWKKGDRPNRSSHTLSCAMEQGRDH